MKALIVYCHPSPKSFNHAVLETVQAQLSASGAEHRLIDLYAEDFRPTMSLEDWTTYEDTNVNTKLISRHVDALQWCDTLVFIYPTWWFGPPAMLKGWLDRVLVPGIAFSMPTEHTKRITHNLLHIHRLAVFTTCGASWFFTKLVGSPGKRILVRGLRSCLNPKSKVTFAAHYLMDSSTPESRARHLEKIARKTRALAGAVTNAPHRWRIPPKIGQTA